MQSLPLTHPRALEKCTNAAVSALRSGTKEPPPPPPPPPPPLPAMLADEVPSAPAGDVRNTPKCCSQRLVCEPACDVAITVPVTNVLKR